MTRSPSIHVAWLALLGVAATSLAVAQIAPKAGEVFRDCAECPQMVVVPPGEFIMGETEDPEPERLEGPKRAVRIDYSFAVGKFELTNGEYRRFVEATGHKTAGTGCNVFLVDKVIATPGTSWADPDYGRPIRDDEPVACIRWSDAKSYVSWLAGHTGKKYRLLTEAEWEYAARAGTQGRYVWDTAQTGAPCRVANTHDKSGAKAAPTLPSLAADCDDGYAGVAPVGQFAPNAFGLYDMIGNVWEWIEDCYEMPYGATGVDGSAQLAVGCDRRGSRGGSWRTDLKRQRPAFRGRDPEALTSQIFGTRVARDL
ncbi:MAG TPA: formylglycine-generating enzyme family protein [Steroidobacteraceae bacterium]|nr:formylglycine-generating enzyme family protein [Steroidobacteraceae bacterium]HRX88015.1 formylglycine-generating enzyme family protein [Steroidobacteraceae bacterium]